jgi:flagellin
MNAYRNYNTNTSALSKNLEKLSSGYRINRAGDDAAGLAISEKMRAQISGLEQASNNVKDGISLVQTAEGALQEVQDMLNRMVTLAEESANGTYQDDVDRENLQAEMDALKKEINRIADSANFNGINLLDGSMSDAVGMSDVKNVSVTNVNPGAQNGTAATGVFTVDLTQVEFTNKSSTAKAGFTTLTIGGSQVYTGSSCGTAVTVSTLVGTGGTYKGSSLATALDNTYAKIDGVLYKITANSGVLTLTGTKAPATASQTALDVVLTGDANLKTNQGNAQSVTVKTQAVSADANKYAQGEFTLSTDFVKDGSVLTIGTTSYTFKVGSNSTVSGDNVIDLSAYKGSSTDSKQMLQKAGELLSQQSNSKFIISTDNTNANATKIDITEKKDAIKYTKDWDLSKGTNDAWNGTVTYQNRDASKNTSALTLQIGDTSESWNQMTVSIDDMHTDSMGIEDIDIKTQSAAASAISVIKDAINYVSSTRGTLGATQNRLEHTSNNLSVMTENIQDAESTIRDTDIADEMTAYTKNQILVQSAQAMLAQANSVPQGVLQLLQ